ncbi:MAG TPA: hypothetical protein VFB54_07450 [Burkholderiales bacterium]|nr:hypothetical protein [Burkholderiales bacterium]
MAITVAGCDERRNPQRPKVDDTHRWRSYVLPSEASAAQPPQEDDFTVRARREMQALRAQFDALRARADAASGAARERFARRIAEMEPQWHNAEARFAEARSKAEVGLQEAREKFWKAVESLRQSMRDAQKEFDRS